MAGKLPDVKQKVKITDGYKKPLADIRKDVDSTKSHFKKLGSEIKRASSFKNLKKLKRGIADVKMAAAGMGAGFAQSGRRAVYTTGIVGAALGGLVTKTAGYGDNIAKTAKKLNLTVSGLQEYRHAADLSGIAQAKFDNGMLKFQKRLGETVAGIGYAKDIYRDLGIQVKDTNGNIRPTEELFEEVADSLVGMDDKTKRTRYAMELFGRAGADMFLMMRDGSKGIREMRQEARDLGGIMDKEATKKSEEFIDTMARTKQVVGGVVREFGVSLMPAIIDFAKELQMMIKVNRPQIKKFFSDLATSIPRVIGRIIKFFSNMRKKLSPIFNWIGKVINSIGWENSALIAMATFIGGPFLVSLSNLIPLFSGLFNIAKVGIPIIKSFWIALAGGPVGWIIAGLVAVVAAIIYFRKELAPVVTIIRDTLTPVIDEFKAMLDEVKVAATGVTSALGASGLGGVFSWYGQTLVKVIGVMARIHFWISSLPLRAMIAAVRSGIKIWTGYFNILKRIVGFVKKLFAPQLDWIGDKFDKITAKFKDFVGMLKPVISKIKELKGILFGPEEQTIAYQDKDLGPGSGKRRAGLSGRQLTDQIGQIGDPTYGPTVSEAIKEKGGVGGVDTQSLLQMTGGNKKGDRNKLEVVFKNPPKGMQVGSEGDSDIDIDAGFAFGDS